MSVLTNKEVSDGQETGFVDGILEDTMLVAGLGAFASGAVVMGDLAYNISKVALTSSETLLDNEGILALQITGVGYATLLVCIGAGNGLDAWRRRRN